MVFLNRLRVLTAGLGVAAATAAAVTSLFGDFHAGPGAPAPSPAAVRPDGGKVIDELAVTKFSLLPALAYQVRAGDTLFAWQIKPTLDPAPVRPRDVLVLVDTSASQAGKPLQQARQVVAGLSAALTADDRVSVWTLSTPAATRALTKDFQPADAEDIKAAAAALTEIEYGSGATDLKGGLSKALATLAPNRGRHQIVLFLGDGESAFDPLTESDRVAAGGRMDQSDVYFFAVPLGLKLNANNLHGLAALTGGAVVRVQEDLADPTRRGEFLARLKAAIDVPVLKADKCQYGAEVTESYPTKLPPLRADKPTLVIGKMAKPAAKLTATVTGTAANRDVTLALAQDLPPAQADHFFLNLMIDQWRDAPHKDAPAMLQADRALALASTQVKLYREEFLTQANWAVTMDRLDDAAKLYTAARRIDPNDGEAGAGLALVEKMKTGRITRADLDKRIAAKAVAMKLDKNGAAKIVIQDAAKDPPAAPAGAPVVPGPPAGLLPPDPADLVREAAAQRQIEEQRYRVLVEAAVRRARQQLRTDPDGGYQDLKRMQDELRENPRLGPDTRAQLAANVGAVMQEIYLKGAQVKREAATEREQLARSRQRLNEFDRQQNEEDRTRSRIDAFRQLMQQARYELAYQEAQLMIQERISRGQAVPAAATASYIIGQQATQLREWRELTRIREDRFLLTMMQVEKSHIPYPDEPPVHFPPAAVWRELTGLRKERYENSLLGQDSSPTQKKIQSILENTRVSYEKDLQTTPLNEVLADLAKRYDLTFVINKTSIENSATLNDAKADKLGSPKLDGITLGTFLDIYLRGLSVPNVTYVVRPEYIELTSYDARLEEKVTRVFPVADLVIPIPSSVNQATLQQNQSVQNQTLAIFGAASLYGGGLQNAFAGGFGGGQNAFAQPGGLPGGQPGGMQGNLFMPQNAQGGIVGLGGNGGLGQFGNLGGQFGLQGSSQYRLLEGLIFETIAKGEWANVPPPAQSPTETPEESFLTTQQRNSLGFYPPSNALIVRGTSRYHTAATIKLKKLEGGMAAAPGRNDPNKGVVVIGPNSTPRPNPAVKPEPAKDPVAVKNPVKPVDNAPVVITGRPAIVDPKLDPDALAKKLDRNPKRMWNQAIDWTVTNPGMIVACADFLMEFDEFGAAAEVLKGNLRKGLATEEWAHEALAISLQMSKAPPEEVERAALSGIDLDPADAKAYLKAAKAEAELKNHDLAVAFCKRAAECSPDQPGAYANALAYAEHARDVKPDTIEWASTNLLRRDWVASDGIDYHARTRDLLPKFAARFKAAGVKADGVDKAIVEQTQRDLVVELLWQGSADLDLTVAEPSGSICSTTSRRTTAGGVLKGDLIEQTDDGRAEVYTAAAAFPGTYKVSVKTAFGRAVGNTATIKVTRFKGTAKESHDLVTVDLTNPAPVEIKLDGGSRTELAAVSTDRADARLEATATAGTSPAGLGGGFGSAGSVMSSPVGGTAGPDLPPTTASREQVLPGAGGTADIRASYKLNADRKTYSVHVNAVFATAGGKDVKLPKVSLLPGGEK